MREDLTARLQAALDHRYAIERAAGRGGMATVFLAIDRKHRRRVALKVLHPELAATMGSDRFLREIAVLARLTHPHILPLYDSGEAGGLLYYVMPFVEGDTLQTRIASTPRLPVETALEIARDVASGLAHAHAQGVIHRDIKPANILLDGADAVITDFGIARAVSTIAGEQLTGTGFAIGTPCYMSPEQAAGERDVGPASDIYSLGCVLYEMLAGTPPFEGSQAQAILARHQHEAPPSLRALRPDVPPSVQHALDTALAKAPEERFATAADFARALHLPGTTSGTGIRRRAIRPPILLAGLAAAAVLGAGIVHFLRAPDGPLDPTRVVVFPLLATGPRADLGELSEHATLGLVTALSNTATLKVVDGWTLLDPTERRETRALTPEAARAIARRHHAGYYIAGRLLAGDSTRSSLTLFDVAGDSMVRQAALPGAPTDAWALGLAGARALLPGLIPPGGPNDLPLYASSPAAMASFLRGEQAYRRARFGEALEHYRAAVDADSTFAVAALRGALAANWAVRDQEGAEFVRTALRHEDHLSSRFHLFARALDAFFAWRADSAVALYRRALALDPEWAAAWMGLGEVYHHLLPANAPQDSLAEAAFAAAHRLDPSFAPAVDHLLDYAVRRGDAAAIDSLFQQFRSGNPDPDELARAELMVGCLRAGAVDWRGAARASPTAVGGAAQTLAVGGRQAACAATAWRAVLAEPSASAASRWGALVGLFGILLAENRLDSARALLEREPASVGDVGYLHILGATVGSTFEGTAAGTAARLRTVWRAGGLETASGLWFLGVWAATHGGAAEAFRIADSLGARAPAGPEGEAIRRMGGSIRARAFLAFGDTTRALELLTALVPAGNAAAITWTPWSALPGERFLRAQILFARGRLTEARGVAQSFDSPASVTNLLYLRPSLLLRCQIAARTLDRPAERECKARLARLDGVTP